MVSGVSPALAVSAFRVVYEDYAACKKRFITWGQNSKSPPKWRITIYQLICHYTSHGMNIHQRTLWKPQISLYLITFSETKPWSSLQFEYTSCDGVLARRNSHMGRNRKRFHSNSHCGLLELRLADNKMGEGISNSPTGLSVWTATETVS